MDAPGPRTAWLAHGCCRAPPSAQTQDCSVYAHDHRIPSVRRGSSVNTDHPKPKEGQARIPNLASDPPGSTPTLPKQDRHRSTGCTRENSSIKHVNPTEGSLTVWGGKVPRVLAKLWYICWAVSSRCQPQPATDRASPREERGSEGVGRAQWNCISGRVQAARYQKRGLVGPGIHPPTGSSTCGQRCDPASRGIARGWPQTAMLRHWTCEDWWAGPGQDPPHPFWVHTYLKLLPMCQPAG